MASETLLDELPGNSSHNGSRLQEGPDGYMYFCTGDMYMAMIAQDLDNLGGRCFGWIGTGILRQTTPLATASTATATAIPRVDVLGKRALVLERTRSGQRRRGEPHCGRGQLRMAAH